MGYETLEAQVNQNLVLKKFCRIPLDKPAPDSSTLIKLNQKYGEDIVKELNKQLMKKLADRKIIRGRKLRVDTTVVESIYITLRMQAFLGIVLMQLLQLLEKSRMYVKRQLKASGVKPVQ